MNFILTDLCAELKNQHCGAGSVHENFMKEHCRKSCGLCGNGTSGTYYKIVFKVLIQSNDSKSIIGKAGEFLTKFLDAKHFYW